MSTLRPEVLVFMRAADTIIQRASHAGVPFSDEEAAELSTCLGKLQEVLRLDD
jgi:hypothetical protein